MFPSSFLLLKNAEPVCRFAGINISRSMGRAWDWLRNQNLSTHSSHLTRTGGLGTPDASASHPTMNPAPTAMGCDAPEPSGCLSTHVYLIKR